MPVQWEDAGPYWSRHWWSALYIIPGSIVGKSKSCFAGSSSRQRPHPLLKWPRGHITFRNGKQFWEKNSCDNQPFHEEAHAIGKQLSSGCRLWLINIACISSILAQRILTHSSELSNNVSLLNGLNVKTGPFNPFTSLVSSDFSLCCDLLLLANQMKK